MNADAFRHFYDYHFSENRNIWDTYITPLSQTQFVEPIDYSMGSVRNHIVHLVNVDNAWFSGLRGMGDFNRLDPDTNDRDKIRAHWDHVEQDMHDYLRTLRDDMLLTKPLTDDEDKDLILWQVLLHVVNHGTDHRAQLLRLLNDLGVDTGPQDYIFYVYENP